MQAMKWSAISIEQTTGPKNLPRAGLEEGYSKITGAMIYYKWARKSATVSLLLKLQDSHVLRNENNKFISTFLIWWIDQKLYVLNFNQKPSRKSQITSNI